MSYGGRHLGCCPTHFSVYSLFFQILKYVMIIDRVEYRISEGRRGALYLVRRFITMLGIIVYYSYSERVYFSLFNDVYIILIGQN